MECCTFSLCRLQMINYIVLLVVLVWTTGIKYVVGKENKTLAFVIVMYHHGDRSPKATYPRDIYPEDQWPQGFGQLTQVTK
ncbi:hypothetical protein LSH36_95g07056 [Paralvinella palmiformis]|uniref:Lysosomal acid phosphatase n=1 Tax=Paralvinella palmiformis TaxID=53620 RepID=A0AAD9K0Q3_9ANNE|nr:hypothetical protein LSH36_95g07056 [Paralvinella palmiformis]